MGYELLKRKAKGPLIYYVKRSNEVREILREIIGIRELTEDEQKVSFKDICGRYGKRLVIRVCCDLVVSSSGEEIPIPIWDLASQKCSRTPSLDPALKRCITEKQMTKLIRNCIVTERWDGRRIVARQRP